MAYDHKKYMDEYNQRPYVKTKQAASARRYYAIHADAINESRRRDRERHPEKYRESYRHKYTVDLRYRVKALIGGAKTRAKRKGIAFSLDRKEILDAIEFGRCQITGLPFVLDVPNHPRAPSLDRIDNNRGYVAGNVQVVCAQYNAAKGAWAPDALVELASAIVKAHRKKRTIH